MDGTVEADGNIFAVIYKLEKNVFSKKFLEILPAETLNAGISQETLASLNYVEYYGYTFIVLHEREQSIFRWISTDAFH